MLDMGTGGGGWLSGRRRPARTVAFMASKVRRLLGEGDVFLTRHVGSGVRRFRNLLGLEPPPEGASQRFIVRAIA